MSGHPSNPGLSGSLATRSRDRVVAISHPATSASGGAPTRGTPTTETVACLFWDVSGDEVSADALAERGRYRIDIAATVAIDHTCTVTLQGKDYRVLWAPPPYEAGRIVGLETA